MKITDVKATVVEGNFDWILVKVYTDEDVSGIGEAFAGAAVRDMVYKLRPFLLGEDPLDVDRIFQKLYRAFQREMGITLVGAISGIEIALWDIAGKVLKTSVYRLLGGKFRDKVRVYADCHAGVGDGEEVKLGPVVLKGVYTPEAYAEKARRVRAKGFTALKFDIDLPARYRADSYNRSLSNDELKLIVSLVEAAREAAGSSTDMAVDCHWQYSVNDAIRLANKLEPYDLMWLEDPIPPENFDAMTKVSREARVPICTGEHLITRHGFRQLIEKQAADIISPDVEKAGGILEVKKIAEMADVYYTPIAPHNIASPLGTIAAVHMCASTPNFLVLEFHAEELAWWEDLIDGVSKPLIRNGLIELPSGPGLGIRLNEEEARKRLKKGETLFE